MNQNPIIPPPRKNPEKTGLALFAMVGGFVLLIIIIGWVIVATRGPG